MADGKSLFVVRVDGVRARPSRRRTSAVPSGAGEVYQPTRVTSANRRRRRA